MAYVSRCFSRSRTRWRPALCLLLQCMRYALALGQDQRPAARDAYQSLRQGQTELEVHYVNYQTALATLTQCSGQPLSSHQQADDYLRTSHHSYKHPCALKALCSTVP